MPWVDVAGFGLGPPEGWPMGIGAGRPSEMVRLDGAGRWTFEWDADRLIWVGISVRPDGALSSRRLYRWQDDGTLDAIEIYDVPDDQDQPFGPGARPSTIRRWTWAQGRPKRVETRAAHGDRLLAVEDWAFGGSGLEATIDERSDAGPISVRRVSWAPDGRLLCAETEHAGTVTRRLEVRWADGRLLGAVQRSGPGLATERDIAFHWDDSGRLVEQTSRVGTRTGRWSYRYPA